MKNTMLILIAVSLTACATVKIPPFEGILESNKAGSTSKVEQCLIKKGYSISTNKASVIDTHLTKVGEINSINIFSRLSIFPEGSSLSYTNRMYCAMDSATSAAYNQAIVGVAVADNPAEKECVYIKGTTTIPDNVNRVHSEVIESINKCINN